MKGKQQQKRGTKRRQVVVFKPDERADYITGFRKRKAQRRKDAQDQIKAKAEGELKDIRREKNEKTQELLKAYEALQTEMKAEIIEPEDQVVVQQDDFSKKAFGADAVVVTTSMGFDDLSAPKQGDSATDGAAESDEESQTEKDSAEHDVASDEESDTSVSDKQPLGAPQPSSCCAAGACGAGKDTPPFTQGKAVKLGSLLRKKYR